MGRIRAPPTIGYKGPFKTMEDVYRDYRNTLMNRGHYKAYFTPRFSYGETSQKFRKPEYSPERQTKVSEGERKEQRHETNAVQNVETKNETNKPETSQKTETMQEKETPQKIENRNELTEPQNGLSYEKIGLPYEKNLGQTDIRQRNRPSQYYDRAESRW